MSTFRKVCETCALSLAEDTETEHYLLPADAPKAAAGALQLVDQGARSRYVSNAINPVRQQGHVLVGRADPAPGTAWQPSDPLVLVRTRRR